MVANLIVFEVLLLLYCLFFAREILIEEGLFFVLGLFSAIVLSDLLLTWTILLSFALGIVFWWRVLSISRSIKPYSYFLVFRS